MHAWMSKSEQSEDQALLTNYVKLSLWISRIMLETRNPYPGYPKQVTYALYGPHLES